MICRRWKRKPQFIRSKKEIKEKGRSGESVNSQDRETLSCESPAVDPESAALSLGGLHKQKKRQEAKPVLGKMTHCGAVCRLGGLLPGPGRHVLTQRSTVTVSSFMARLPQQVCPATFKTPKDVNYRSSQGE